MRKSRYNIGHFLPWTTIGGVECATLRIAQGVEGKEFKNTAFHLPDAPIVKEMFSKEGFDTSLFQAVEPSYRHPSSFLRSAFSLARELKRRNIDLVHCSDLVAAYYTTLAGRLARVPVLCHIRCCFPDLSVRDKSFLYPVTHFAFVSHHTRKHFAYKIPASRGTIVYDGIKVCKTDASEARRKVCKQYDIPENAKIVGMVGRVVAVKDYATLVRAAARVVAADKNVRFLIVGAHSGSTFFLEHYEIVKKMLAASDLAQYFIFTDFQSDVTQFLDAMDIFVLSTHSEGLPLVILEAMAQGKPVIATAVGGIPEIIKHEKTGLLHRHKDDLQFSEQIIALLRDKERAKKMGMAGQQAVKTDWSPERFAADMKFLYRQIILGKRKSLDEYAVENLTAQFEEKRL